MARDEPLTQVRQGDGFRRTTGAAKEATTHIRLLVLRTALEDRFLKAELPGYQDYARDVRRRLAPGIW
jgi:protein-S-isoprenylcysteine O-methyltransferase Ste14